MLQSSDSVVVIYPVADLFPGATGAHVPYHGPCDLVAVLAGEGRFHLCGVGVYGVLPVQSYPQFRTFDHEPDLVEVRDALRYSVQGLRPERSVFVVANAAEPVAARFAAAIRLTADQLLADAGFRRLARVAAEKGKRFTADLLEYERKPVVVEAVKVVVAEVAAERAEQARVAAAAEAARLAKLEAERPTREAVEAAYESCEYRTCTQGHSTRVEIGVRSSCGTGTRVGVSADTHKGDRYSSRCTFRRVTSHHTLYVRADYLTRVRDALGTTTHDGGVILDAEPVGYLPDLRVVYRLTLVRQAAGTGLKTESVEVARGTGPAEGRLVEPHRKAAVTRMPAPILADYLQDRDVPEDVTAAIRTA